ncbi:MAG: AbrB/MazE/SpoVT family DNA-binding domain-containing protein [Thermoanaerobaculia bacterium]|nr:AbrB/MazE/SpoVT family DNA-binding domain-containing protein [Thermoanaerobaculia bacterium]
MPTLAKKTSKNQLTLPKAVVDRFPGVDYFDVTAEGDRIVLRPVRVGGADEVRERLAAAGIDFADVTDAIAWARRRPR